MSVNSVITSHSVFHIERNGGRQVNVLKLHSVWKTQIQPFWCHWLESESQKVRTIRHPQSSWWARVDLLSPPFVRLILFVPHPFSHKGPLLVFFSPLINSINSKTHMGYRNHVWKSLIQFTIFFPLSLGGAQQTIQTSMIHKHLLLMEKIPSSLSEKSQLRVIYRCQLKSRWLKKWFLLRKPQFLNL